MSFNAKVTAVFLAITSVLAGIYVVAMAREMATTPASEIPYQGPVLLAVIVFVVLFTVAIAVVAAHAALTERRSDGDEEDERDRLFNLRGDRISNSILSLGVVLVLGLVMVEAVYFWIAQALLAALVGASIIRWIAVLVYYRRGY
jgi:hypothetical protein